MPDLRGKGAGQPRCPRHRRCDRAGMVDEGAKVVIGDVLDGEGQRWPRRSVRRRRTPTSTSRAPTSGRQPSQPRSTGTASSTCLLIDCGE